MKKRKWNTICVLLIAIITLYFTCSNGWIQNVLRAATITAKDDFECNGSSCDLYVIYDSSKGTLMDQINANIATRTDDGSKPEIRSFYLFPNATADAIPHVEWTTMRDTFLKAAQGEYTDPHNASYRIGIDTIVMNGVKMENDILPDHAFDYTTLRISLELPSITNLTKDALKGMKLKELYLPESLTTLDPDAIPVFDTGSIFSPNKNSVRIKGDTSLIYEGLRNKNITEIHIDTTHLSNSSLPLMKDTGITSILLDEGTKAIDVNLNTWFDVTKENANTIPINFYTYADNIRSFSAEGFTKFSSATFSTTNFSLYEVKIKDCGFTSLPRNLDRLTSLTKVDLSGNQIDFSTAANGTFYHDHAHDGNFLLLNQKPNLKIKALTDVEANAGDQEPTITPGFLFSDNAKLNLDTLPVWIDPVYANTYATSITHKDNPALDMNTAKTYTRTYYSPNGVSIGSVKIIVSPAAVSKETPTITLTSDPATNITTDTKLTLKAVLGKTGSADLNTGASVEFFKVEGADATSLGTANMADGEASLPNIQLSEGSHTIKAVYSGNDDFNTVDTTINITVSSAPVVGKETPTITLSSDPATNITTDTKLTLKAVLGKTGSADLNTGASVEFFEVNGVDATSLGTANMADGEASLSNIQLSEGSHTIKAVYSGNDDFNTVDTTINIRVQAAPPSGKLPQQLQFAHTAMTVTYGDSLTSNPYTKSETAASGSVTFSSSDPAIASVHADTGVIDVHKIGAVTITITIAEDSRYLSASASYTLTIEPRKLSITGLQVENKEYDGTTAAKITGTPQVIGILAKDQGNVSVEVGTASFIDASAQSQKEIQLKNFSISGSAKENYILTLPKIYADIQQKPAVITIQDAQKQAAEKNPAFTYTIDGLVGSDTKEHLLDFVEPALKTSADQTSEPGEYAITGSGASSKNYTFTYKDGILHILGKEPVSENNYTISGTKGNDGWYVSDVTITPENGYTQIWDGTAWKDSLTFSDGEHENIQLKLRKEDGTESDEITIPLLQIDTIAPRATNIKNGDIYLLNRLITVSGGDVKAVTLDGQPLSLQTEFTLNISDNEAHILIIEDVAGNTTTYTYQSKTLDEYAKQLNELRTDNVELSDYDTIIQMRDEVKDLLEDTAYAPSEEQKAQLKELQAHCEELLAVLANPVGGVQTGDDTNVTIWTLAFLFGCTGMIFFVKKLKNV